MKKFEVHITGDETINAELDKLGIKNIMVELLRRDLSVIRTEYMSSFVIDFERYEECYDFVNKLASNLNATVLRIKIECPVYLEYIERSVYIEAHFKADGSNVKYPLSRNVRSGKLIGTDRSYSKEEYNTFIEKWKAHEVELCLFDDFIREDFDWFNEYKHIPVSTGIKFLDNILKDGIPKEYLTMIGPIGVGKSNSVMDIMRLTAKTTGYHVVAPNSFEELEKEVIRCHLAAEENRRAGFIPVIVDYQSRLSDRKPSDEEKTLIDNLSKSLSTKFKDIKLLKE